jgi:predicted NBD/HSP70 family sugar kinase/biotin operon repressor
MESTGAGSLGSLRERNRRQLLEALRARGSASRADLARVTGLSRSTVSTLVSDLQASGLVVEHEPDDRPAQQGRPPTLLTLDQSAGLVLGIDFGHEQVHVAIADLSRTILAERVQRLDVDRAAREALTAAVTLTDAAVAEAGLDPDRILCAGVGLSGPIDRATGTVHAGKILPGWDGILPVAELQARLNLTVHLDNDANLGALAEMTLGAGIGVRDAVYLMVSGGIGAGLILNGEIYRGAGGTAGELGHVLVDESGPICRCGNRGCLETMAGGPAIIELLRHSHDGELTLERVIALAVDGDSGARRAIGDAGRVLGRSVATMVNAFNPELVVVGGYMAAAGDILLDPLREAVDRYAIPSAAQDVRITGGVLGERAEVLGALELAARQSDVPLPATSHQVA